MLSSLSVKFEPDVPLMLRDGTITYADVYRPDKSGRFPALIKRTPYDKSMPASKTGLLDAIWCAGHGYAVVIQDIRGRFSSEGEFYAFVDEIEDGYDSVEWTAAQSWCNGKVGMFGSSYVGAAQWLAASAKPPSLRCIVPGVTASDFHDGWTWRGGAFELGFNLHWALGSLAAANWDNLSNRLFLSPRQNEVLLEAHDNIMAGYKFLPMREIPELEGGLAPYYYDWLDHPEYDDYWRCINIEEFHSKIEVPSFNIGGWYDIFLRGTLRNFSRMRDLGATGESRRGQQLIIGPWIHSDPFLSVSGEVDFGTRASSVAQNLQGRILRFCDFWLKGEDNGVAEDRPVRIFVMGENVWRAEDEWPLSRSEPKLYYLHSGGKANTLSGDGWMSLDPPASEAPDVYVYNPIDPVPTRGGSLNGAPGIMTAGAFDQRSVERRPDVLMYTTPPLEQYMEVTGPIAVTLYASTSARDTDFTAKLVDVSPDGRAVNLTDGIVRARYRTPRTSASLIEIGQVIEYTIDMSATSNLFRRGHRIRLEISSSNYPRFDRNTNTGEPIGTDSSFVPALQTIYHTSEYPSHVILPVVPRP